MPTSPKHIVTIRLSAMGDVAMTVPIIRALTQQYPDVKVTMISRGFFRPFFDNIPNVEFFAFDDKSRHNGKTGIWQLFKDIKALKPNAFVDLHNVIRTKTLRFLFWFTTVKIAVIYKGRKAKKEITALENKKFCQTETVFEKQLRTFASLGFSIDLDKIKFPEVAVISQAVIQKFNLKNSKNKIGIAPFAQYESKIYPVDLIQNVIDNLSLSANNQILLFGGGQAEILQLNQLAKNKKNVVVVAGESTFEQEIAIISNLDIMLSMDSGNAHIAAMLGIPVVTLWGATHPYAGFNPFGQPIENALVSDRKKYPKLPTSVYGNKTVIGYEDAMRTILPETVVAKINTILSARSFLL